MEFQKPDIRAIKSWRISETISFVVVAAITAAVFFFAFKNDWQNLWVGIIKISLLVLSIIAFIGIFILPKLEYMQWGYIVEDDKVIIRHGIFWVKKEVIPVIRIQNLTVSQGPINRRFDLYKIELSLASGDFVIEGLDRETADDIAEKLRARLYQRIADKGVL